MLAVAANLLLAANSIAASLDKRIAVILSRDIAASREALQGFTETVPHPIVAERELTGDAKQDAEIIAQVHSTVRPDLILAVGTAALEAVVRRVRDIPVVYAMVLNPASVVPPDATNVTGASMNVAPARAMQVFEQFGARIQRVGVIFDPEHTGYLVEQATRQARDRGMQLISKEVRSTREAVQALDGMQARVDALWMVPDSTVLADAFTKALFLFSYRNNVPVVGLSEKDTDRGAIVSLGFGGSRDIGAQAGEIANRILEGNLPVEVPHTTARRVQITVNPKGARKLGVEIPASLLAVASNVVQAPVYDEGDWWVYRVTRGQEKPKEYRVVFTNGRFEGDSDFLARPYGAVLPAARPVERNLAFPFYPGKTWSFRYWGLLWDNETVSPASQKTWIHSVSEVTGRPRELIETPAGTFAATALRVRADWPLGEVIAGVGESDATCFYSSQTKSVVKLTATVRTDYRGTNVDDYQVELIAYGNSPDGNSLASQTSAGSTAIRSSRRELDLSSVQAPVYHEGDWWVFRVKQGNRSEDYRVTYRNEAFEASDASFLSGGRNADTLTWLPLASVQLADPERRWLEFPLVAEKKWSFSYVSKGVTGILTLHNIERFMDLIERRQSVTARMEVVGPALAPIVTPAGTFESIEIHRTDSFQVANIAPTFTYFYSPETRSVVKLEAHIAHERWGRPPYEMELVAYGHRGKNVGLPRASTSSINEHSRQVDWSNIETPVYSEGDWWVFRFEMENKPVQQYRVEYRNGRLESDIHFFSKSNHFFVLAAAGDADSRLDFPLMPGKHWLTNYMGPPREAALATGLMPAGGVDRYNVAGEVLPARHDGVETGAGRFPVVPVRMTDETFGLDATAANSSLAFETVGFYSPETRSMVRVTGKLQILSRGIEISKFEIELLDYGHSGSAEARPDPLAGIQRDLSVQPGKQKVDWSRIEAPIYEEGDWWVFRVQPKNKPSKTYTVTYTNGKFQCDDPEFLTIAKDPDSIAFLPLISVHLTGPDKRWFDFPLTAGYTWNFRYRHTSGHPGASGIGGIGFRTWRQVSAKVVGLTHETIGTSAGQFKTIEIRRNVSESWGSFDFTYFYSPETKSTVKVIADGFARTTTGRNEFGYAMELVAYGRQSPTMASSDARTIVGNTHRRKGSTEGEELHVEAPVYQEGDWWVYRISIDGRTSEHRIEYRNGRFESDGPDTLRIGDAPGEPGFLPWATVHVQDPHRKWLDFPLSKGKQWQFSYTGSSNRDGLYRIVADAQVMGPASRVKTAAGTFDTVEILRTDTAHVWAKLSYFYSPETKSIVKLSARHRYGFVGITGISHRAYELELIRYGRKAQNLAQAVAKHSARPASAGLASSVDGSSVSAPEFTDGDWWTFRVKTKNEAQTYKFVRRNGVFESDIAFFTGKPSMVLSGGYPSMRDVHFPLEPGKKWNGRYPGPLTEFAFLKNLSWRARVIETAGEVIGLKLEPVETPAGVFEVVEVRSLLRNAGSNGDLKSAESNAEVQFTGYYSPEAKCMVRLIGELKGRGGSTSDRMEIELVAYGRKQ